MDKDQAEPALENLPASHQQVISHSPEMVWLPRPGPVTKVHVRRHGHVLFFALTRLDMRCFAYDGSRKEINHFLHMARAVNAAGQKHGWCSRGRVGQIKSHDCSHDAVCMRLAIVNGPQWGIISIRKVFRQVPTCIKYAMSEGKAGKAVGCICT